MTPELSILHNTFFLNSSVTCYDQADISSADGQTLDYGSCQTVDIHCDLMNKTPQVVLGVYPVCECSIKQISSLSVD